VRIAVLALAVTLVLAAAAHARPIDGTLPAPTPADLAAVSWHHSRALGKPFRHGRLIDGTRLHRDVRIR
jgi:hypothetical protein